MADTILIVDDDEGVRNVLRLSLAETGYEVITAATGREALARVKEDRPSIVLADIKMPGMDGIELLKNLRQESPETEVIMMTGHAELDLAISSLRYEAADFITKPINYDALEVALKRVHERIWMKAKIREYTEGLERMVSEKTQLLLEAERLATMGQTVATLAHAIKNIIGGLSGGMYVVERGIELNEKQYMTQGWDMVKRNVEKIKRLALDLLLYSKERVPNYDLCDPNIPAREVYHLMLPHAEDCDVRLSVELAEDLGRAYFDPEGIYSCLLNLVSNSVDACCECNGGGRQGEVVIRSRKVEGWSVEYEVSDNGCGMDEETRKKVFRAFFSTKGSKGTGLGLMISEKIIREHGGAMGLESEPGKGTKVFIRLPIKHVSIDRLASTSETDPYEEIAS